MVTRLSGSSSGHGVEHTGQDPREGTGERRGLQTGESESVGVSRERSGSHGFGGDERPDESGLPTKPVSVSW